VAELHSWISEQVARAEEAQRNIKADVKVVVDVSKDEAFLLPLKSVDERCEEISSRMSIVKVDCDLKVISC